MSCLEDEDKDSIEPSISVSNKSEINVTDGANRCRKSAEFCTVSNLTSSVVFLSQELQNLGLQWKLIEGNGGRLNLVGLINSCYTLLQLYQSSIKDGNTLFDQKCRDTADITHLQGTIRELRFTINEKEKQAVEYLEKERQTASMNKALAAKLKSEKDEIRRLNGILQQKEAHYQHEIKKKEVELNKLKERLHKMISGDRGCGTRNSRIAMNTPLNKTDRSRSKWRTDDANIRDEEELYHKIFGQYENWISQLSEENDQLKHFILAYSGKLTNLASNYASLQLQMYVDEAEVMNSSLMSLDSLENDPLFSLSFQTTRPEIERKFDANLNVLEKAINSKEREIETTKEESSCLTEDSELSKDENVIVKHEIKKLQKEKELLTQAFSKLHREKCLFESEKVELLRQQFLEDLPQSRSETTRGDPFTPNSSFDSAMGLYGGPAEKIPAIPVITAPHGNVTVMNQPITIGPTCLSKSHRSAKYLKGSRTSPHTPVGRSAPASRNTSLTRGGRPLAENYTTRTLDRPVRLSKYNSRSSISSTSSVLQNVSNTGHFETLCDTSKSSSMDQSMNSATEFERLFNDPCNMSQSINYPPIYDRKKGDLSVADSTSTMIPNSPTESEMELIACGNREDYVSNNSDFYHDKNEHPVCERKMRFQKGEISSNRLNALENSLFVILKQIEARNKEAEKVYHTRSVTRSSPEPQSAPKSKSKTASSNVFEKDKKLTSSKLSPLAKFGQIVSAASGSHPTSERSSRFSFRVPSAPISLTSTRRSSREYASSVKQENSYK